MEAALKSLRDAATLAAAFASAETAATVERISSMVAGAMKAGGKVMICGNGGSLCDAVHFAEELTGRYRTDRPALPAIAIADAGHITCTANDYGFEQIFARGVEALGRPGDVLIVLSTSGNSENVVRAVAAAKAKGMTTAALLGKGGGRLAGHCDAQIVAPGATADRIQELHMLVLHIIVDRVEVLLGHAH